METNIKSHLPALVLVSILLILSFILPISFFGKDGFNVWMPALAEYLRGTYKGGGAIFGGQALFGIYGQLPFWVPLRFLDVSALQLINITYVVFVSLLYFHCSVVMKGLRNSFTVWASALLSLFIIFNPIITNRVFPGHFNLLFGILPFLVATSIIYSRSKTNLVVSFFSLWCAFSIQSYQILSYYIFYIPLLYVWIKVERPSEWKRILLSVFSVMTLAFLVNIDVFLAMIDHAKSLENTRNTIGNIVYSFISFNITDLGGLIFSDYGPFTSSRTFSFFHESNYPIGLTFIALLIGDQKHKKLLSISFLLILFGYGFASNWPVFNLLSEVPLIKLFRVPQRVLIVPVFVFSLIALSVAAECLSITFLAALIGSMVLGNLVISELLLIPIIAITYYASIKKTSRSSSIASGLILSTLFWGLTPKITEVRVGNERFSTYKTYVEQMADHLKLLENDKIVHFEASDRFPLTVAANYLGIRTYEGYGHPPKRLVDIVRKHQPTSIHPFGNLLFFYDLNKDFNSLIKELGVTDVIYIQPNGRFKHVITGKNSN